MKAMILAAGLGTRLQPITNAKPKALVEVKGVPLIEWVLQRLIAADVTEVIINLHHFPELIKKFLRQRNNFGIRIEFSEEPELLDTGGGLKQVQWFFDDPHPFLVHNVDVLSDIDFGGMLQFHKEHDNLVTLAVNHRETNRYFLFDEANLLCGWKSLEPEKTIMSREPDGEISEQAFCGIQVLSPRLFPKMTEEGPFSIVDCYLRLAKEHTRIRGLNVDSYRYLDIGKLAALSAWEG